MWKRQTIGERVFLQTVDTAYEVVSKTPTHILCKAHPEHAVKIDMALKRAEMSDMQHVSERFKTHVKNYNVKLVPYFDCGPAQQLIEPDTKNDNIYITMAIALIAADRSEWTDFIPAAIKTRDAEILQLKKQNVAKRQNAVFVREKRNSSDESFSDCENGEYSDNSLQFSEESSNSLEYQGSQSSSESGELEDKSAQDDVACRKYNPKNGEFEPHSGGIFTQNKQTKTFSSQLVNDYHESEKVASELFQRASKERQKQEELMYRKMKQPGELQRLQTANLHEPDASKQRLTNQVYQNAHSLIAEKPFDIEQERVRVKLQDEGVSPENGTVNTKSKLDLLERFAPKTSPVIRAGEPVPPVDQLKKLNVRLPPSIQKLIDKKNAEKNQKTSDSNASPHIEQKENSKTVSYSQTVANNDVWQQLREIRKANLHLTQLIQNLEDSLLNNK